MIRLAQQQGILSSPTLNRFQHFASVYWLYLDRRTANESFSDQLELQTFSLLPERWGQLYKGQHGSVLAPPSQTEDVPVDDIDEIARFYDNLEASRAMNGEGAINVNPHRNDPKQWGGWT